MKARYIALGALATAALLVAFLATPVGGIVRYAIAGVGGMKPGEPVVQTCANASNTTVSVGSIGASVVCFHNEGAGDVRIGINADLTTSAKGFILGAGERFCQPGLSTTYRCRGVTTDRSISATPYF